MDEEYEESRKERMKAALNSEDIDELEYLFESGIAHMELFISQNILTFGTDGFSDVSPLAYALIIRSLKDVNFLLSVYLPPIQHGMYEYTRYFSGDVGYAFQFSTPEICAALLNSRKFQYTPRGVLLRFIRDFQTIIGYHPKYEHGIDNAFDIIQLLIGLPGLTLPVLHSAIPQFHVGAEDLSTYRVRAIKQILALPQVHVNWLGESDSQTHLFSAETVEIAQIFIAAGVDIFAENNKGKTA
eukprot:877232_1